MTAILASASNPAIPTWDPSSVAADLAGKVASRSRHINLLLGAGASRPAGLPDVKGLLELVLADLDSALRPHADKIFEGRMLEDGLSRIRRIKVLLGPGEKFEGFDNETVTALDASVSALIIKHLQAEPKSTRAHEDLASWIVGEYYTRPLEIFTINYDLLLENALVNMERPAPFR